MSKKILGLDLGTDSLGWGLVETDDNDNPIKLIDCGVRIFESGLDGDISSGKGESRCLERRMKRGARKLLKRRRKRLSELKSLLQADGFLPSGDNFAENIAKIDAEALKKYSTEESDQARRSCLPHTLPYRLRALALDVKLDKLIFGRIIYHLAQRRGFLSNRRSNKKDEVGIVKKSISELSSAMNASGSRTLGEYLSRQNPCEKRIRGIYTSRQMYIDEFNQICNAQAELITTEQRNKLYDAIFFQRNLKSVKHLIADCVLEPSQKRCPYYKPEAQQFRYLQTLNNLRVIDSDESERDLTSEEWQILCDALGGMSGSLDANGRITVVKAKQLINLPKKTKFSIEAGGEKSLCGDGINGMMINCIGNRWKDMNEADRAKLLHDLGSIQKDEVLKRRLLNHWHFEEDQVEALLDHSLPDDYCSVSSKAIKKLLPEMWLRMPYQTAVKKYYPETFTASVASEELPALDRSDMKIRNPMVSRTLNQARKVVNAIIAKYGKPDYIRIELARDMKNSREDKKRIIEQNRENEAARERARRLILDELNIDRPKNDDIIKVLLWEECNKICPYTQRSIAINSLIGDHPQFHIEHIIPYSRSLDNSFANKTLCWHEENTQIKQNRTPYEAYAGNPEKYQTILMCVAKFKSNLAKRKKFFFELQDTEEIEDFSSRQLNDTRYATKFAMQYIGHLYGGIIDQNHIRRIQSCSGGITALVRKLWGMNRILGDGEKNREDHRHHTVDAIAIAMTSPALVKRITDFVKEREKRGLFNLRLDSPMTLKEWPNFLQDLTGKINNVNVSHWISHKISGPLHDETIYSRDFKDIASNGKVIVQKHVRKQLQALEKDKVRDIVDPTIRKIVEEKLLELNVTDPKKAFSDERNLPCLLRKDGTVENRVKYVKIMRTQNTTRIGSGDAVREVVTGNNHHMEIVAVLDKDGKEVKWEGHTISMLEAATRLKNKLPVICRNHGENKKFKFSICCGDIVEFTTDLSRELLIVRSIPQSRQIALVKLHESRKKDDVKKSQEWFTAMPDSLRKKNCRKMSITPLGEVKNAND